MRIELNVEKIWTLTTLRTCCSMAVYCSVLQCVAVCCSVLQCVAVYCGVLRRVAVCCIVLQCVDVCCGAWQCDITHFYLDDIAYVGQWNGAMFIILKDVLRGYLLTS